MPIEQYIHEMESDIVLLHNRKFIGCIAFIGVYYVSFLGFLIHQMLHTG